MAKRGLQDVVEEIDTKAQFGQRRLKEDEDVEMGEFEDPWEDELEEEEEITVEGDDEEDEELDETEDDQDEISDGDEGQDNSKEDRNAKNAA